MTPAELQEAIRRFEDAGGKVQVIESGVATRANPKAMPNEALIEALREVAPLGIQEACRRLRKSAHTLYLIADSVGIEFAYNAKMRADAAMAPKIRRLAGRMRQIDIAEQLGISRTTLRRVAAEHHININSRAP